jgi:hypothetical protein
MPNRRSLGRWLHDFKAKPRQENDDLLYRKAVFAK